MTPQEIFNKAYLGVVAQGSPSFVEGVGCAYRSEVNGQKRACGVGHVIDDDLAAKMDRAEYHGAEGVCIDSILDADELDKLSFDLPRYFQDYRALLMAIQDAHDFAYAEAGPFIREDRAKGEAYFTDGFKMRMRRVSYDFNLTVPEIPQ